MPQLVALPNAARQPGKVFASRMVARSIAMCIEARRSTKQGRYQTWLISRSATCLQLVFGDSGEMKNMHHAFLCWRNCFRCLTQTRVDSPRLAAVRCRVPVHGVHFAVVDVLPIFIGIIERALSPELRCTLCGFPAVSASLPCTAQGRGVHEDVCNFSRMAVADLWASVRRAGIAACARISSALQPADDSDKGAMLGKEARGNSPVLSGFCDVCNATSRLLIQVGRRMGGCMATFISCALRAEWKGRIVVNGALPTLLPELIKGSMQSECSDLAGVQPTACKLRGNGGGKANPIGETMVHRKLKVNRPGYERRLSQILLLINSGQWVSELLVFAMGHAFIWKRENIGVHMVFTYILKINATFRMGQCAGHGENSSLGPAKLATQETLLRRSILHVVKKLMTMFKGRATEGRCSADVVAALQVVASGYFWSYAAPPLTNGCKSAFLHSCHMWPVQRLLRKHFMFILSHASDELLARRRTVRADCIRSLWCTASLFEVMWQNGYVRRGGGDGFVPQVTTMLKHCMRDTSLRPYACAVLRQFAGTLSDSKMFQSLSDLVATVVPCIDPVGTFAAQGARSRIALRECYAFPAHLQGLQTLRLLVIGCRSNACCPAFDCVPSLPHAAAFVGVCASLFQAPLHSADLSATYTTKWRTLAWRKPCSSACTKHAEARALLRNLRNFAPLIRRNCEVVQRMALLHVTRALECNTLVLDSVTTMPAAKCMFNNPSGDGMVGMGAAISSLYWVMFNVARRAASFSRATRVACAECLGELGVVGAVGVAPGVQRFGGYDAAKHRQMGNIDVAIKLLRHHLVKDLVGARDTNRQDHVAFAIQELLRFVGANIPVRTKEAENAAEHAGFENVGILFPPVTRDLIRPYWTTRYQNRSLEYFLALLPSNDVFSIGGGTDVLRRDYSASAVSAGKSCGVYAACESPSTDARYQRQATFDIWAHNWSTTLIAHSRREQRNIFVVCRGIRSTHMSLFLLPYLVQNVLYTHAIGSAAVDGLAAELFRVLAWPWRRGKSTEPADQCGEVAIEKCTHAIFLLLDQLQAWAGATKNADVFRRVHRRAGTKLPSPPPLFFSKRRLRVWLEGAIPQKILASAAMRCLDYERALRHIETHLRHKYDPKGRGMVHGDLRPETNRESDAPYGPRCGVRFSRDDVSSLHAIHSSIRNEPDGLSGVSALRARQYPAMRTVTAKERACEYEHAAAWNQALTCYEQQLQECDVELNEGSELEAAADCDLRRERILRGQLRCLRRLGHLTTIVSVVEGETSRCPDLAQHFLPAAAEALWRLGRWDDLRDLMESRLCGANGTGNPEPISTPRSSHGIGALGSYTIGIARCLLAFCAEHRLAFTSAVAEAQSELLNLFAAASMDSYHRVYPTLVRLHAVRELQHSVAMRWHSGVGDASAATVRTTHRWATRLRRLVPSLSSLDEVLAIRRVIYQVNGHIYGNACEAQSWLVYAKHASVSARMQSAEIALLKAAELDTPGSRFEKASILRAQGRYVLALRELGKYGGAEQTPSVYLAERCTLFSHEKDALASLSRRTQAMVLLLANSATRESGIQHGERILECYKNVTRIDERWECGWFELGKYYDFLLKAEEQASLSARHHLRSTAVHTAKTNRRSDTVCLFLFCTLRYYGHALRLGHTYMHDALPRLLSLWFNHGHNTARYVSDTRDNSGDTRETGNDIDASSGNVGKGEKHPFEGRKFPIVSPNAFFLVDDTPPACIVQHGCSLCPLDVHAHAHKMRRRALSRGQYAGVPTSVAFRQCLGMITGQMKWLSQELAAYQWLAVLPQLVSRVCHEDACVWDILRAAIIHLLHVYPAVAPWMVCGVAGSKHRGRRQRACSILTGWGAVFPHGDSSRQLPGGIRKLFFAMVALATKDVGLRDRKTSLSLDASLRIPSLCLELPRQGMLDRVPLRRISKWRSDAGIPSAGCSRPLIAGAAKRLGAYGDLHNVHLSGFLDVADVMPSKERPKKVTAVCSDGVLRNFLCKREARGDLRKDMRMMELSAAINRLFLRDRESKQRKLRVRTYAVICLNEECGLIEWVENLCSFRQAVKHAYALTGMQQPVRVTKKIKQMMERIQGAKEPRYAKGERYQREVQALYPPRFFKWFLHQFPEPTSWYSARLHFTRSAAVWATVGTIIGLGDRHAENILLDTTCGECVHVDFDCIFDKGLSLLMPEIVPFRLTPNMVDGMGVCGYEGVFRRGCEVVMDLLRAERHMVLSVLESFLHDPLVEWGRTKAQQGNNAVAQGCNKGGHAGTGQVVLACARSELRKIEKRLDGIYTAKRGTALAQRTSARRKHLDSDTRSNRQDALGGALFSHSQMAVSVLPISVEGYVDRLLIEATSHENLAHMYMGWMPFL